MFKKPEPPPPPPRTPTRADASVLDAGARETQYASLISNTSGSTGLKRKASTVKPSLIGSTMS